MATYHAEDKHGALLLLRGKITPRGYPLDVGGGHRSWQLGSDAGMALFSEGDPLGLGTGLLAQPN